MPAAATEGFEGRNSAFDALTQPRFDERARQQFVSQLRRHIMVDMAASMRKVYEREVEPGVVARAERPPRTALEVRRAMLPNRYFRAWSAVRTTAQEMTWSSVRPQIERDLPKLVTADRTIAGRTAKRGVRRAGARQRRELVHLRRGQVMAAVRSDCRADAPGPWRPWSNPAHRHRR
jgi:hypothetical protein